MNSINVQQGFSRLRLLLTKSYCALASGNLRLSIEAVLDIYNMQIGSMVYTVYRM